MEGVFHSIFSLPEINCPTDSHSLFHLFERVLAKYTALLDESLSPR